MISWSSLDIQQQFTITLATLRRRQRELRKLENVVAIGVGFRYRLKKLSEDKEICLRFVVTQKKKQPRQCVPQEIISYTRIDNIKHLVRIPTDVIEHPEHARPHLNLTAGMKTFIQNQGGLEYGSACCIVSSDDNPDAQYLLTCYHLVSPSMMSPTQAVLCLDAKNNRLGKYDSWATSNPLKKGQDAALILLENGSAPLDLWNMRPLTVASDYDIASLSTDSNLLLCGRKIAPAAPGFPNAKNRTNCPTAIYHGYYDEYNFLYPKGYLKLRGIITYESNARPGDSGAALMDMDGTLYGMHFYGDGKTGYALAAPSLFDTGVFRYNISLI